MVPLKEIEHGVYGDLIKIYSKPYSIYLRATLVLEPDTSLSRRACLGIPCARLRACAHRQATRLQFQFSASAVCEGSAGPGSSNGSPNASLFDKIS